MLYHNCYRSSLEAVQMHLKLSSWGAPLWCEHKRRTKGGWLPKGMSLWANNRSLTTSLLQPGLQAPSLGVFLRIYNLGNREKRVLKAGPTYRVWPARRNPCRTRPLLLVLKEPSAITSGKVWFFCSQLTGENTTLHHTFVWHLPCLSCIHK